MEDFDKHIRDMEGFHRRYMVSNKVLRFWANMVKDLDIEMIVPIDDNGTVLTLGGDCKH